MSTTDPFTDAALDSAASKYASDWDAFEQEPVDDWGYSEAERRAHIAGWKAARAHLAAQEPSLIDRMLAVMPEDARAHWDTMDDERQRWGGGVCRCYLCDALIAARSVGRDAR